MSHTVYVVGPIPAVTFYAARIVLRTASITRRDLGSLAELVASTLRTRAAAPAFLADQALRYSCLALAIVVGNVVGVVPAVPRDFTWIELASASVIGFYLIALAESIATSAVGIAAPAVERRDEAGLDARFGFAIVLCERPSEKDGKK